MWKWWLNNTVKGTQAINNSPYLLKLFSVSVSYQLDLHYSNLFPPLICFENHVHFSFVKLKLLPFALRSLFFYFFIFCKLPDLLWNLQFKNLTFDFNALLKKLPFPGFPKGSIWSTDMPSLTSHTERNWVVFSFDRSIKNQDMTDTCVKTCPNFQTSLWKKVHIVHLVVLKSFFFVWLLWFICYSHSSAVRTEEALHGLLHTWASASEYQRQTLTAPPAGTQPTKYANRFDCTAINGLGCADVARLLIGQRVGAVKFWD